MGVVSRRWVSSMQISYSSHTCVQLDMRSTTAIIPQHHMHIIIQVTNHYIIVYIAISYNNHASHYKYPIHHNDKARCAK